VGKEHRLAADNNTSEFDDDTPLENFFSLTEDSEMLKCFTCLPSEECYLNLPDDLVTDNPLDMENIREKQDADNALQQHLIDKLHCEHCQRNKLSGKGYGLLPEREIRSIPFEECAVDLIGPWIILVRKKPYEFNALTVIDIVSN